MGAADQAQVNAIAGFAPTLMQAMEIQAGSKP